jgi:hypothetical protein
MSYYNISEISMSNNWVGFAQGVNNVLLDGWLGVIIMLMIFGTFFFALKSKGYPTIGTFAVSCWAVALSAMLLRPMLLITDYHWWIALILVPLSIAMLWASNRTG